MLIHLFNITIWKCINIIACLHIQIIVLFLFIQRALNVIEILKQWQKSMHQNFRRIYENKINVFKMFKIRKMKLSLCLKFLIICLEPACWNRSYHIWFAVVTLFCMSVCVDHLWLKISPWKVNLWWYARDIQCKNYRFSLIFKNV